MTRRCVTDEQYGKISRRVQELLRRIDEGTLSFTGTINGLQRLIENNYTKTFVVKVNYGQPLQSIPSYWDIDPMLHAAMREDECFSTYFPNERTGQQEITFEYINIYSGSEPRRDVADVLRMMKERNLRPPNLAETIAFREKVWKSEDWDVLERTPLISLCGSHIPANTEGEHDRCERCQAKTVAIVYRYNRCHRQLLTSVVEFSHSVRHFSWGALFLAVREDF